MFAYVKGIVADITEDCCVIDVHDVGVNIHISAQTAARMPGIGQEAKLYTYTSVREDAFWLYGFLSKGDLEMFKRCITVSGIGPKGALGLLSVMDGDQLRFAILAQDVKALSKAPGIGKRTAERLVLELKDKLPQMIEQEQFALLASDGMLVKRPILVGEDFAFFGFKEADWAEKLLK